MATWPTVNPVGTTTDADSDSISGARGDINQTIDNIIEVVDMFNIPASPTDNYILRYNSSSGVFDMEDEQANNAVTDYTNGVDNRIITSSGATTINAEANFTFDGSNALLSGSAGGLTSPILELVTDNSGWDKAQLMCTDSTDDVFSQVGQANDTAKFYQWNITLDPNNTKGRSGVTTWAGDYFVEFKKNYFDQAEISIDHNIYGAHGGYNMTVLDDFNSNSPKYTAKPIRLKGEEIQLFSSDTTTPFGNFTQIAKVDSDGVEITDTKQLKFGSTTTIDKDEITTTGGFTINVDSDTSSNEAFVIQSSGTDVLSFSRGPGGDAEMTVTGDGFFIKDEDDDVNFSMDLSSAGNTGINVIRTDENKTLSLTLKTDDSDDTGNFDGAWNFRTAADKRKLQLEYAGSSTVDIFEVRDSADVATAEPVDIFEFKIPPVIPSYTIAGLPTTVVAGALALVTDATPATSGSAIVLCFFDGSNWKLSNDPIRTVV